MANRREYQRNYQKLVVSKAERLSFLALYRKDQRDIETPYKVIADGKGAQRFETEGAARGFFLEHDGRAIMSVTIGGKVKYLAYKFK